MNLLCRNASELTRLVNDISSRTGQYPNYVEPIEYPVVVMPVQNSSYIQNNITTDSRHHDEVRIRVSPTISTTLTFYYFYPRELTVAKFDADLEQAII